MEQVIEVQSELIVLMVQFLPVKDQARLSMVSKNIRNIMSVQKILWFRIKEIYVQTFRYISFRVACPSGEWQKWFVLGNEIYKKLCPVGYNAAMDSLTENKTMNENMFLFVLGSIKMTKNRGHPMCVQILTALIRQSNEKLMRLTAKSHDIVTSLIVSDNLDIFVKHCYSNKVCIIKAFKCGSINISKYLLNIINEKRCCDGVYTRYCWEYPGHTEIKLDELVNISITSSFPSATFKLNHDHSRSNKFSYYSRIDDE